MSMSGNKTRKVSTPHDLIFHTDGDDVDYPIYILPDFSVVLKRRPSEFVANFYLAKNEDLVKTQNVDEIKQKISELGLQLPNDIDLDMVIEAYKNITNKPPDRYVLTRFTYEVYQGNNYIGDAVSYALYIFSVDTPFSGQKGERHKAWGVAFSWKERMVAKYPAVGQFTYVKGEEGRRGRAWARIQTKIPITTPEFEELFYTALGLQPQKEEKLELTEEEKEKLLPMWLRRVYLVIFTLPSEWIKAKYEWKSNDKEITMTRTQLREMYKALGCFRSRFLQYLASVAVKTQIGWILVDYNDRIKQELAEYMRECEDLLKKLKIDDYPVKPIRIVEIYLPKDVVEALIDEYIKEYKAKMEQVVEKLKEIMKSKEELREIVRKQAQRHSKVTPEFLEDIEKLEKEEKKLSRNLKNITKRLEVAEKLMKTLRLHEDKTMPPLISERVKALLQTL